VSGETEKDQSGWTVDTSRADLIARLDAQEKFFANAVEQIRRETAAALEGVTKANEKQERQDEERFKMTNEFRGQLDDQATTFLTRETYEAHHQPLVARLDAVEKQLITLSTEKRAQSEHQNESRLNVAQVVGILTFIVFVVSVAAGFIIGTR
jgi:hypothetical protein